MIKMDEKVKQQKVEQQKIVPQRAEQHNPIARIQDANVKALVEKGKQQGYLTYEALNSELPEENLSPDRLDNLLMTLDDLGIELIDEADLAKRLKEGKTGKAQEISVKLPLTVR